MMKRLKKIYYMPGLISALLVPVLFYNIFQPMAYEMNNQRLMPIKLCHLELKNSKEGFQKDMIPSTDCTYQPVDVRPNDPIFRQKANAMIHQLEQNNIDRTGIRFKLSDKNTYGDFIALMDLLQSLDEQKIKNKNGIMAFASDAKDIYVLHYIPEDYDALLGEDIIAWRCGYGFKEKDNYLTKSLKNCQEFIRYSPKASFYLFFGFLLFLYAIFLKPRLNLRLQRF